ncbi:MAG TPA: ABC transporter permease [Methylomirabilota bacterium]|jgi:phospholipid/cholesterol/gamma-HCH transport system permease protein
MVTAAAATLALEDASTDTLVLRLAGDWSMDAALPSRREIDDCLDARPGIRRVTFDVENVSRWDSALLVFLLHVVAQAERRGVAAYRAGLPQGLRRLLALATAVPARPDTGVRVAKPSWLARVGTATIDVVRGGATTLGFVGETVIALARFAVGRARYRRSDLMLILQEVGAQALPIVSLISFLVGVILAYVGAVQLRQFGAQIYVADLVGIGMTREMGAMMAAVIMAGRTGAAFAAQLGTMQVNEEVDALTTLGIAPMEFLVLPRILALGFMMPLMCLYADLLGLLGGMVVGIGMLDLGVVEYYVRTIEAISIADCVAGLIKASVFGVLIAMAGCLRGIQCGRSSAAVGAATTSAVVTGIVLIVVSDAITTVVFDLIGL